MKGDVDMLKVAVTNLKKYNEGDLQFKWVDLPQDDLQFVFNWLNDDEYFISDYECELFNIFINEEVSLTDLNDLAEQLDSLDDFDLTELQAILESEGSDIFEAMEVLENKNYSFYYGCDLEAVAEMFVDEGFFGEIPRAIENYIDFEKIARDLKFDGYIQTSNGVIYYE